MNPAFMLVAREDRVHDVFAALAASSDSRSRSRLALHLPWSPARIFETEDLSIRLGIQGWHGWAPDVQNLYSFSLSLRGDAPCDLSVYVGKVYALFELRASTGEAAEKFIDESTRTKSRFVSGLGSCVEGIWYDNEHDPWRVVYPREHVPKIRCSRDDIRGHMISIEGPSDELVDIDKLGDLLVWLLSPEE